ncbi:MAG: hypothetical protein PUE63_01050 [Lachnospiraceae bacterium]|jgi:hypothetical protein|nr:hypothetical protein [Lachnospiraceae bacterium]
MKVPSCLLFYRTDEEIPWNWQHLPAHRLFADLLVQYGLGVADPS